MSQLIDPNGGTVDYHRISVTDSCDERCLYCVTENYRAGCRVRES